MKKSIFQFFILLFLSCIFFISCQKSSSNTQSNVSGDAQISATSSADNQAEDIYNNVFDNVISTNTNVGLGNDGGVFGKHVPGPLGGGDTTKCFTVTIDTTVGSANGFPVTVILDFGTGCTGLDGHTRMGKITTVFSNHLVIAGSTATTTFQGYYVDSILVQGTHTIKNVSTGGVFMFSVNVTDGKLTAPSGNYIAWNKSRTWTQVSGQGTPTLLDDAFSITGTSAGTLSANDSTYQWTTNITAPCLREIVCPYIVKGQVEVTWNSINGLLDFGNGTCDNAATVTVGTKTFNITLR